MRSIALRKARTALGLPLGTLLLTAVIWVLVWLFSAVTSLVPICYLAHFLGHDRGLSASIADPSAKTIGRIKEVARAMELAARYHPLKDTCYAEALIARMILSILSVDHVVVFGVRKKADDTDAALEAHAWVTAGSMPVCGVQASCGYTVVRCFASI
ncbi:MAG: lasso peptide biosynthesis B2 protein [Pseudomonadota bacterium]